VLLAVWSIAAITFGAVAIGLNGFSWSRAMLVVLGAVWLWFVLSDLRHDESATMTVFVDAFRYGVISSSC
jgi:hypothetical protein